MLGQAKTSLVDVALASRKFASFTASGNITLASGPGYHNGQDNFFKQLVVHSSLNQTRATHFLASVQISVLSLK